MVPDSKVGLSAHWGPYCVPGWTPRKDTPYGVAYAEWYWQWMQSNQAVEDHHRTVWADVPYDAFIDGTKNLETGETVGFRAEEFDADAWMELFERAGVRYFFITAKHHDGFCIFDSDFTERDAVDMGPRRDLFGELVAAARKRGIRVGLYYSFYEWFNPAYTGNPAHADYAGFTPLADRDLDGKDGEYVDDFMVPQIKGSSIATTPTCSASTGSGTTATRTGGRGRSSPTTTTRPPSAGRRSSPTTATARRRGTSDTRGVYGDFYHVEYHADIDRTKPWSMWRGFGNSYGYNRNEHPSNVLTIPQTIQMLVDVVSDNGNIEFNLGPKADGTLAAFEVERLEAIGAWLDVNGEAIYGTRKSPFGAQSFGRTTYDAAAKRLYLHVDEWPEGRRDRAHRRRRDGRARLALARRTLRSRRSRSPVADSSSRSPPHLLIRP